MLLLKHYKRSKVNASQRRLMKLAGCRWEFCFDTYIHMVIEWCSCEVILVVCLNICLSD